MRKVKVGVRIDRPVEDVFAYVIAVETMPEWRGDVAEAGQVTDGPIGVGTRIRAGGRFLGRPLGIVVEVTELEPGAVLPHKRRRYAAPLGPAATGDSPILSRWALLEPLAVLSQC